MADSNIVVGIVKRADIDSRLAYVLDTVPDLQDQIQGLRDIVHSLHGNREVSDTHVHLCAGNLVRGYEALQYALDELRYIPKSPDQVESD